MKTGTLIVCAALAIAAAAVCASASAFHRLESASLRSAEPDWDHVFPDTFTVLAYAPR